MPKLSRAPLVEVIFELRWRRASGMGNDLEWAKEESFLPGLFRKNAESYGFTHSEGVNAPPMAVPFLVTHRFRENPEKWPCFQIGLGLFTANVTNEFYEWQPFKRTVLDGLRLLEESHNLDFGSLPIVGVSLKYVDGLVFPEGETPVSFMRNRLRVSLEVPGDLLKSQALAGEVKQLSVSFAVSCTNPRGTLVHELKSGRINGQEGLVATTNVRSAGEDMPEGSMDRLEEWLDKAHAIQRQVFGCIVEKEHMESFG